MPGGWAGGGSDGARTALLIGCSAVTLVALLSLNRDPIWGKHSEWVLSRSAQQRHYRHDSGVRQPATARSLGDAIGSSQCGSQYFALCLAVKNNHRYIREWIAHHRAVGVGKIYIYDTGSHIPLNDTVQDHIASGFVEYIYWQPDFGNGTIRRFPQNDIYSSCLKHYRERHQFIGFIDADEFLIPKWGNGSVTAFLKHMQAFGPIGGLVVNWVIFGSSGHETRPKKGVLQSYTQCWNRTNAHAIHIKSIVNTDLVADAGSTPHEFSYANGTYAVNEHHYRCSGPRCPPSTVDHIALHHYVTKSEEDYRAKMALGSAMGNHKNFTFFTMINEGVTEECTDGLRWGPYT